MTARDTFNFHLPLPGELHSMLREEAEEAGVPATALAREALADWLKQRRKDRLFADLQAYAIAHAGTEQDRDEALLDAAMEILAEDPWPEDRVPG
jgi:hypothetical protein